MKASTQYRDDWRSAIYDATGDYVKTKRAMELAELNGLFDLVDALDAGVSQPEVQTQSALRAALQEIDEIGRKITDLKNEHGIRMGNIAHAALLGAGTAAQAVTDPLRAAAERVRWFDWSDNDMDACAAMDALRKALTVPSANGGTPAKHTGTYLGYKSPEGHEMHCANAFCPHLDKCVGGCINRVAIPSTHHHTPGE